MVIRKIVKVDERIGAIFQLNFGDPLPTSTVHVSDIDQIGLHQAQHGSGLKLQLGDTFLGGVVPTDHRDGFRNVIHGIVPPLERGTAESL